MSTKLGWRIISTYFLLLIIGLLTIYNVFFTSFVEKELSSREAPLLQRSQQVAREIEVLEEGDQSLMLHWKEVTSKLISDRESIRYLLLDADSSLIFDSYNFKKKGDVYPMDLVDLVMETGSYKREVYQNSRGEDLLYTAYPIYDDENQVALSLVAMTSIDGYKGEVEKLLEPLVLLGLGFILISLLVYFWVLKDIFKPLDRLDQGVVAMTRGNYSHHIDEGTNEFSTMVRSLNTLGSRLADIEEQQKDFVSTLSHELKTPIASMKIITDSLIQAKDSVSSEILYEFLEDINSESDRLKDIIDDLLFMASLERQDVSLSLDVRPITRALEESIRVMEPLAEQRNIKIHKDFKDKYFAEFDYNKMKQVFINILGNAVKYSEDGGDIFVRVHADRDLIHFEIEDRGMGIAAEEIPFVFDRFYRVDRARSRERGGSGLGLHIVQQIINLHNGKISLESVLDEGSKILIDIPRVYEV